MQLRAHVSLILSHARVRHPFCARGWCNSTRALLCWTTWGNCRARQASSIMTMFLPEIRPTLAQSAADEYVGMLACFLVGDTKTIPCVCSHFARCEVSLD